MKKFIINLFLVCAIIGVIICIFIEKIEENKLSKNIYASHELELELESESVDALEEKQYEKEEIADFYEGYEVCAKLEIPDINLETYVLSNYSDKALKVSVTKLGDGKPNENGNFCIVGHNYKRKNMFSNLKKLEIGDQVFLIDNVIGKVEYEIFKMYEVMPNDVSCLEPEIAERKEVTLITCTSDSSKRIIIKAKEVM